MNDGSINTLKKWNQKLIAPETILFILLVGKDVVKFRWGFAKAAVSLPVSTIKGIPEYFVKLVS
jgi:hypothetical protein